MCMLHVAYCFCYFLQLPGSASSQGLKQETEVCKSSVCIHPVSWPHMMTGFHVVPGQTAGDLGAAVGPSGTTHLWGWQMDMASIPQPLTHLWVKQYPCSLVGALQTRKAKDADFIRQVNALKHCSGNSCNQNYAICIGFFFPLDHTRGA